MLVPYLFGLITWRECVLGLKETEGVQMELRRTWDVRPKNIPNVQNQPADLLKAGGGVNSETLGFVRWSLRDTTLFDKPCKLLRSDAYDQKAHVLMIEEVWVKPTGDIVRQREERRTQAGTEIGDAAFYDDRIELNRIDVAGKPVFATLYPADGMSNVQKRFAPLGKEPKEFLRLDAVGGSFHKVKIEPSGRFAGSWGGETYRGLAYRFTIDGIEQTLMLTPEGETVQIQFDKETALVLAGIPKSHRKFEPKGGGSR